MKNKDVFVIDNLFTGRIENISNLTGFENFKFIPGDIRDERYWNIDFDIIFHMAAIVGVKTVVENLQLTIDVNNKGTENIINMAENMGSHLFIFSSSEVYGRSSKESFTETDDFKIGPTNNGRWVYAATKMMDEFLALTRAKEGELKTTILRLFNTVGEKQLSNYGMVIPRFVEQALNNQNITVYDNGKQSRCFMYVEDLLDGIEILMDKLPGGETYNLGNNEEITIIELAKKIIEKTNSKSKIEFIPYENVYNADFADMERRKPNNKKMKKLGWSPKFTLDDILDDILKRRK